MCGSCAPTKEFVRHPSSMLHASIVAVMIGERLGHHAPRRHSSCWRTPGTPGLRRAPVGTFGVVAVRCVSARDMDAAREVVTRACAAMQADAPALSELIGALRRGA